MKNFLSKEKQIWGNRKVDVYLQGQTKCLNEKSVKKHRRREWFKTKRLKYNIQFYPSPVGLSDVENLQLLKSENYCMRAKNVPIQIRLQGRF